MDKDGKLGIFERQDYRIGEEFDWNVMDMCTAIQELRDDLENKEKELERANDAINSR